ncbi:MAG TPA: hypothetical protein VHA37_00105, partial [Candidatus Saccharimonadales bacterium]|nr:hypothetical protein [Candidatus Saccharimonadales bacterium]
METNSDTIARTSLELAKRLVADGRPPIAISDVDQTLSHETRFDSRHNSHEPVFSADVIGCGRLTPLLLASARRANHPFSFAPWRVGLVPEEVPLILENGGIIARLAVGGVAAEPTGDMALHDEIHARVEEVHSTLRLPAELVVKHGLSMASLRLQNPDGSTLDHLHAELTEQVQNAIGDERIEVVNTGASV